MTPHAIDPPARRPLRVFAFDPMASRGRLSEVTVEVENELLGPGPSGARVRVVDYDATRGCFYEPVDLNDSAILMQAGLDPSEADPRFHQQMVYAVTLKVLENFDKALGRRITFRGKPLLLLPHAFRDANAFFDRGLNGVCFGYFNADPRNPGNNLPGQAVFTCLSQDIIAHEVTHAIVHRLRRFFVEPSNDDVLAFHEGIADVVAIFQHFTFPNVLSDAVASTRGELASPSALIELAAQFGHATGRGGALRSALEAVDPRRYESAIEPHERGSILVAAIFDAFFAIYQERIRDLVRIASEGRGILPEGDLHPDLVERLAREASGAAQSVLTMCIRAFEYLPPVDVTFGDFLRALITADYDLLAEAGADQRRAMIEAFRRRGIYPDGVMSLSEDALRWPTASLSQPMPSGPLAERLVSGAQTFRARSRDSAREADGAHEVYENLRGWVHANRDELGLDPRLKIGIHGFHATFRIGGGGELLVEVVAQFTQMRNTKGEESFGGLPFRGGATVVASADGTVRFVIGKSLTQAREDRQVDFVRRRDLTDPTLPWAGEDYLRVRAKRDFRALHRGLVA